MLVFYWFSVLWIVVGQPLPAAKHPPAARPVPL